MKSKEKKLQLSSYSRENPNLSYNCEAIHNLNWADMYSTVVEIVKELTRVHDEEWGEQATTIFIFKRKP